MEGNKGSAAMQIKAPFFHGGPSPYQSLAYCLTKPTLSRMLSIRVAEEKEYVNPFSKPSTQKCHVLPPSHISLAKANHMVGPNFKGADKCNLNLHLQEGNWNTDQL